MQIDGAVIREQGITFAIVVVKPARQAHRAGPMALFRPLLESADNLSKTAR